MALDWQKYIEIADKFQHRAKAADRADLKQDIILALAEAARNNGHRPDNLSWAYRIASFTVAQYWRNYYNRLNGIDCGHCSNRQRKECKAKDLYSKCPKAIEVESLNKPVADKDGNLTELGYLLADDTAIDLEAWQDAKRWLLGCPKRLIQIGCKLYAGKPLKWSEHKYLERYRQKEAKKHQLALA
jgi:DNA-directed RNA polymerase specialized sigma24 family protein